MDLPSEGIAGENFSDTSYCSKFILEDISQSAQNLAYSRVPVSLADRLRLTDEPHIHVLSTTLHQVSTGNSLSRILFPESIYLLPLINMENIVDSNSYRVFRLADIFSHIIT